ncbi:MAG: hypothetical protein IKW83_03700 [Muribaculaceae bacterium]|nr:hypothetical protein [Muribaculaceae bacterium]
MRKIIFTMLIALLVASVPSTIDAKTKKKTTMKHRTEQDARRVSAERKVVGKHMLSLQWISWNYFGSVEIKKEADGTYTCKGEQLAVKCKDAEEGCKANGDYVKLDGKIEIVDRNHLIFIGQIRTKIYHINNGQELLREGTFNFEATGNRKFWRMQEMKNPADECIDYIDIYFK